MIRAVIFDLGNVLIDFDHNIAAGKIAQFCGKSRKQIYDFFFDSELTGTFEEGKISGADFFFKVKEKLDLNLGYADFVLIWNEIFFLSPKNRAVYDLAGKLADSYKIALLSNINELHFDYLKKRFAVFDIFHALFLSFELKLKKPSPLIYKKSLDKLGVSAQEAFYTDDRPELIEEARRLGIHGYVFRDIEKLKDDLSDCKICV